METIKSFTVDHKRLLPGVYVSRKDSTGHDVVTTFDIRMTRPNFEPVMNTAEIHTLEHLGATFLRNHEEWGDKIIYFGPMGCRTGFYLLLAGDYESEDIISLLREMFEFVCLATTFFIISTFAFSCGLMFLVRISSKTFDSSGEKDKLWFFSFVVAAIKSGAASFILLPCIFSASSFITCNFTGCIVLKMSYSSNIDVLIFFFLSLIFRLFGLFHRSCLHHFHHRRNHFKILLTLLRHKHL